MTDATRTHEVVRLRLSPTLRADVEAHARSKQEENLSAVLRDLVTAGLEAKGEGRSVKQRLRRDQYAERAAGLMEALGDLLLRVEHHDPEGALILAQGLTKTMTAYNNELKKRTKA